MVAEDTKKQLDRDVWFFRAGNGTDAGGKKCAAKVLRYCGGGARCYGFATLSRGGGDFCNIAGYIITLHSSIEG